jgi:single-strand DNA-binding protein
MASLNKVILIGHLGRDPEVKYTQDGKAVANFSIATSESWKDRDGNKQDKTEWHNVVIWGKLADICKQYLAKGRQVYVEGKIQTREYTDREGNKKKITEIVANQMVMLGSRGEGRPAEAARPDESYAGGGDSEPISDSDIPF